MNETISKKAKHEIRVRTEETLYQQIKQSAEQNLRSVPQEVLYILKSHYAND